jgi:hypothetical protein
LCIYLLRVYLWIARHDINLLKRRIRWHSSLTTVEIGLSDKGQHARAARKNNERKRKDMRSAKLSVPQSNLVRIAERSAVCRRNQHDGGTSRMRAIRIPRWRPVSRIKAAFATLRACAVLGNRQRDGGWSPGPHVMRQFQVCPWRGSSPIRMTAAYPNAVNRGTWSDHPTLSFSADSFPRLLTTSY